MTKADIVSEISKSTGIDKQTVLNSVESKKRAQKTARNISKNTTIIIPEHNIPSFKPAKTFLNEVK